MSASGRHTAAKAALGFINLKVADVRTRVQYLEAELKGAVHDLEQVLALQRLADAEVTAAAVAMSDEFRDAETWKP